MPKIPALPSKKIIKKVRKLGFNLDHTTGSHMIFLHQDGRRAVIPYHQKDIPKGTLMNILKEAKISREEFLRV